MNAAKTYISMMIRMADSAAVSIPVSRIGKSKLKSPWDTVLLIKIPPSTVPIMIEPTVKPSIQPLAATSFSGGSNSVKMPYLAGE